MADSSKSKAKKAVDKATPTKLSKPKVVKKVPKTKAVEVKKEIKAVLPEAKVVDNKIDMPKDEIVTKSVNEDKPTVKKKVSKSETNKNSFLEPGIKSISLIALSVVVFFAILVLIWEFALPSQYKLSTIVADSKVQRIFLRAEKLKADDNYDVAVIEPCNLAVRFDKNKYTATVGVTKNGSFGVYKDPFNRIFENKDVDVYEFSLTEKGSKTPKAAVVACLDAGLKKNLTTDSLKDITDTLSSKIPDSFTKVANDIKEIPFFNETSKKYFGKNLFQKIRLTSAQNPDVDVNNTFFAFDNKLLFVASQNSPDNVEFQVNSLEPSDSSFDVKTTLDKYKDDNKALNDKINEENKVLKFDQNQEWNVNMDIANIGSLDIQLSKSYGPKSVENFIRLSYRGYYNDTIFHRIVKKDQFNVLQGGDKEKKDGTGGRSAFYINDGSPGLLVDEIWKVAPEFSTNDKGENTPTNTPEFRSPDLYKDYDNKTGLVTFPKGSIAMATTGQPDSASSQFFIALTDTQLPAEYTIFAKVKENSFGVLDKMLKEISPVANPAAGPQAGQDGTPNKELKINTIKITQPQI